MVLCSQNEGKYFTADYWRRKEAGEWDSSNLTAADISFLEIQDGEGRIKYELERIRERADGILHDD